MVNTEVVDKGKRDKPNKLQGSSRKEKSSTRQMFQVRGKTIISCQIVNVLPTTQVAHVERKVISGQRAPGQMHTTPH